MFDALFQIQAMLKIVLKKCLKLCNVMLVIFSWSEDAPVLENINVDLRGNKLVIVIGHVGTGKVPDTS